jgi:hypothetical protein
MHTTHRFWSFDGDTWETHATGSEAQSRCESALDSMRDEASSYGWPEEVEYIMWGPIAERVVETSRVEHLPGCTAKGGPGFDVFSCEEDCEVQNTEFDHVSEYDLVPVDPAKGET